MRLVVDTNVFVSAALKRSSWPAATVRWVSQYGGLLKSPETEQELLSVLRRPRFANKIAPWFFDEVERLLAAAQLVTISEQLMVCRDPTDDKFVDLAVNGRAHVIVSGDADLLVLAAVRGIPIVTPAVFINAPGG